MSSRIEKIRYAALLSVQTLMMCLGFNFAAPYLDNFGVSDNDVGIMIAVSCILAVLLQQIAGRMIDSGKLNSNKFLMFSGVIQILASIGLLFTDSNVLRIILFGVLACLTFVIMPVLNSFSFIYKNFGINVNYGVSRGIGSLCFALFSMVIGRLMILAGNNVIPFTYGLLGALLFILVMCMPQMSNNNLNRAEDVKESFRLFDYPAFAVTVAGLICVMIFHNMFSTFLIRLIERAGGDDNTLGIAIGLAALTEMPVIFLYTRIKGQRPSRFYLMLSGIFFALKAFFMIFADSILMIYAVQCLQSVSYGFMAASRVYYVDEAISKRHATTGQAYITATDTIGMVAGSFIGGIILNNAGINLFLQAEFIIAAVGAVLMIFSAMFMKQRN